MTDLTWIGGGNNRASNPLLWSPASAPSAGDNLIVTASPDNPGPFTMNVKGDDLAGDTVSIDARFTANLSKHAVMSATGGNEGLTFNLSQNSTLDFSPGFTSGLTVNVSGHDNATIGAERGMAAIN